MVTASTLANPNQVISAAIGTLAGPLHGAANQRVVEMLKDIGGPEKVDDWLDERLAAKQVIWGMGHREYKVKDPRAIILEKFMGQVADQKSGEIGELFATARALEAACADRLGPKGVYPNVDFYSGILYSQMGIPLDQFTPIFAISRTAGWMAHWQEQIQANRIFRPTQIYVGAEQRAYVHVGQR
jgi:citrate synthase